MLQILFSDFSQKITFDKSYSWKIKFWVFVFFFQKCCLLNFLQLWTNSAKDKLMTRETYIFSDFSQKIIFDILCKLSPLETK